MNGIPILYCLSSRKLRGKARARVNGRGSCLGARYLKHATISGGSLGGPHTVVHRDKIDDLGLI